MTIITPQSVCCEKHENGNYPSLANQSLPNEELLYELADFFKVFGDSTRIKILYALSKAPLCVCEIAELISMSQSAVSHQLRVLKRARLVRCKREGKQMIYALADSHITTIVQQGLTHITE